MVRCINYINMIQVKFTSFIFVTLIRKLSCRGWGQAIQGSLSCTPPSWVSMYYYFANYPYLKLSKFEHESIINLIQVTFRSFSCRIDSYAKLQGWGQAVQAVILSQPPPAWV